MAPTQTVELAPNQLCHQRWSMGLTSAYDILDVCKPLWIILRYERFMNSAMLFKGWWAHMKNKYILLYWVSITLGTLVDIWYKSATRDVSFCFAQCTSVAEMGTSTTRLVVGEMMFFGNCWFFTILHAPWETHVSFASCQDMYCSTHRVVTLRDVGWSFPESRYCNSASLMSTLLLQTVSLVQITRARSPQKYRWNGETCLEGTSACSTYRLNFVMKVVMCHNGPRVHST